MILESALKKWQPLFERFDLEDDQRSERNIDLMLVVYTLICLRKVWINSNPSVHRINPFEILMKESDQHEAVQFALAIGMEIEPLLLDWIDPIWLETEEMQVTDWQDWVPLIDAMNAEDLKLCLKALHQIILSNTQLDLYLPNEDTTPLMIELLAANDSRELSWYVPCLMAKDVAIYLMHQRTNDHWYAQHDDQLFWALDAIYLYVFDMNERHLRYGDFRKEIKWHENDQKPCFDRVVFAMREKHLPWNPKIVTSPMMIELMEQLHVTEMVSSLWAGVIHSIAAVEQNGKCAVVLPNQLLITDGADEQIRQSLVRLDWIESIIHLPEHYVVNHPVGESIVIFSQSKADHERGKIYFYAAEVDASMELVPHIRLRDAGFRSELLSDYPSRKEIPGRSGYLKCDLIENHHYQLYFANYAEHIEVETFAGPDRVSLLMFEKSNIPKQTLEQGIIEMISGYNVPTAIRGEFDSEQELLYPILNLKNVHEDKWNQDEPLSLIQLKNTRLIQRYAIQINDILVSGKGTQQKLLWIDESLFRQLSSTYRTDHVLFSSHFLCVRVQSEQLDAQFLYHYFRSPIGMAYLKKARKGTQQNVLDSDAVRRTMIPILSISDQRQVVSELSDSIRMHEEAIAKMKRQFRQHVNHGFLRMLERYANQS